MKKFFTLVLLTSCLSFSVSAQEEFYENEFLLNEQDSIDHEMLLACVATKTECITLARNAGHPFLRVKIDRARCPQRPKTKACIVQHLD